MPRAAAAEKPSRAALVAAMAQIDAVLPGSIVVRHMRCGKAACRCKADPPVLHGPYIQWTRTVEGKTVTRFLTEEQRARYQPYFDNARTLRELARQLSIATMHEVESAEGWTRPGPDQAGS
ncbi:MAG: DUF6788 family protein [Actinomycetota bacterium]